MYVCVLVASFLGPTQVSVWLGGRGPDTFYHMSDIKGRKMVETLELNVGIQGLRTARRVKTPDNVPHISCCHTYQALNV